MDTYIIQEGEVVYVEGVDKTENKINFTSYNHLSDEADALRIKVRLLADKNPKTKANLKLEELPWCFPLLPKTFQTAPKVGESVFVLLSNPKNVNSNRYYIGPIISQPQYMEKCPYDNGSGPALSLLQGGNKGQVLKKISLDNSTKGAFPNKEDVAIVGRDSEDIILQDGEIDLRCGIRSAGFNSMNDLKGKVIFNTNSPSYLQLKFSPTAITKKDRHEANSIINVVADKINLISHKDKHQFNLTDNKELIKQKDLDEIMSKLHELPYGDLLVQYLQIMQYAVLNHGHNFGPYEPPVKDMAIVDLQHIDFNKILSPNVRIS